MSNDFVFDPVSGLDLLQSHTPPVSSMAREQHRSGFWPPAFVLLHCCTPGFAHSCAGSARLTVLVALCQPFFGTKSNRKLLCTDASFRVILQEGSPLTPGNEQPQGLAVRSTPLHSLVWCPRCLASPHFPECSGCLCLRQGVRAVASQCTAGHLPSTAAALVLVWLACQRLCLPWCPWVLCPSVCSPLWCGVCGLSAL